MLNFIDAHKKIVFFYIDNDNKYNKDDLLNTFKDFPSNLIFVCISHDENLSRNEINFYKYKQNIHHYFINNKPIDEVDPFRRLMGNYKISCAIVKNYRLANNIPKERYEQKNY